MKHIRTIIVTLLLLACTNIFAKATSEDNNINKTKTVSFMLDKKSVEVNVPVAPKRIVVIGFDVLDIIDALGYSKYVVGVVDPTGPLFPKYLEGFQDLPSAGNLWGDDLESVAGLKPDLIITGSRAFQSFENLSEIAPTVWFPIPGMGNNYQETLYSNIDLMAKILGDTKEVTKVKSALQAKFDLVKNKTANLSDPTALFLMVKGKTLSLYSDDVKSRYGFVFKEFGFKSPASLDEIKNDAATHGNSISYEFLSSKNPNYILVIDKAATVGADEALASDTLNNELVASTKAAKNNQIIYLDGVAWYLGTGGVKATHIMVDNILSAIK